MCETLVTQKVDVWLSVAEIEAMDLLVKEGRFLNRCELTRHALRALFKKHEIKPFYP